MPFTELTCRSGGSNLNPGTTSGSGEEPTANVYTGVGDSDGANVFTPSDGSTPASTVSAGMFGTVYVTAGAVTSGWIGRITNVAAGVNGAITFSTTAKVGTFPAASGGAHTISMRVGGACRGPNGTDGYPLTLVNDNLTNVATNPPRANLKNDQQYQLSAGFASPAAASSVTYQGYTATFGDGGKWQLQGPATGTSFVMWTWGVVNGVAADTIFGPCGDAGSADLVSGTGQNYYRCVFRDAMGAGVANGAGWLVNCEIYNCNRSNTAGRSGIFNNAGSPQLTRCIVHHNLGSNTAGARGIARAEDCIFWANGSHGMQAVAGALGHYRRNVYYANGGSGLNGPSTSFAYIENNAFVANGAFGIDFNFNSAYPIILNNNAYGSGTKVNVSGATRFAAKVMVQEFNPITIASGLTPWNDPDNGDFRVTLAAMRAAGYGAYTFTLGGYSGQANTVDQPDVGGPHVQATGPAVGDVRSGTTYGVLGNTTGTHTDPATGDVRLGVQWGAGGTEFTGSLVLTTDYPATGKVAVGTAYNFGALVGTRVDASVGDVRFNVSYGDPAFPFVGTAYIPNYPSAAQGAFSHGRDEIVAQLLVDRVLGTDPTWWENHRVADRVDTSHDWPVRYGSEGSEPDETITVYETTPVFQAKLQTTGEVMQNWGITIRVRARTARDASRKADAVRVDLDQQCYDRNVTIEGTQYFVQSFPKTTMTPAMRSDFGGKSLWVVNINCLAVILAYPLTG